MILLNILYYNFWTGQRIIPVGNSSQDFSFGKSRLIKISGIFVIFREEIELKIVFS
jgi:hypothetical protein